MGPETEPSHARPSSPTLRRAADNAAENSSHHHALASHNTEDIYDKWKVLAAKDYTELCATHAWLQARLEYCPSPDDPGETDGVDTLWAKLHVYQHVTDRIANFSARQVLHKFVQKLMVLLRDGIAGTLRNERVALEELAASLNGMSEDLMGLTLGLWRTCFSIAMWTETVKHIGIDVSTVSGWLQRHCSG
ncbi:Hypothetical protein D9617_13g099760 [Elsinoe fawcettii]|nr:Hypothetical protein D9617_13g099760 [Elsinoe fawcettii]